MVRPWSGGWGRPKESEGIVTARAVTNGPRHLKRHPRGRRKQTDSRLTTGGTPVTETGGPCAGVTEGGLLTGPSVSTFKINRGVHVPKEAVSFCVTLLVHRAAITDTTFWTSTYSRRGYYEDKIVSAFRVG